MFCRRDAEFFRGGMEKRRRGLAKHHRLFSGRVFQSGDEGRDVELQAFGRLPETRHSQGDERESGFECSRRNARLMVRKSQASARSPITT